MKKTWKQKSNCCRKLSRNKLPCSCMLVLMSSLILMMNTLSHNSSSRQVSVVLGLMIQQKSRQHGSSTSGRIDTASPSIAFVLSTHHRHHGCTTPIRRRIPSITSTLHHGLPFSTGPLSSSTTSCDSISDNNGKKTSTLPTLELLISKTSSTAKLFSSLLSSNKARKTNNLTVVEGYRLVLDVLNNPSTSHLIQHLLVTEEALYSHPDFSLILQQHIVNNNIRSKHKFRVNLATDKVMAACTDTVTPQGVVATCTIPDPFDYTTTISQERDRTIPRLYLVLDGVSDPGNIGTLIRSSVACGVSAIFLLPGCVDPYSSKALRSAMGATFRIPLKSFNNMEECWDLLHNYCVVSQERIYAATLDSAMPENRQETKLASPMHTDIDWIAADVASSTTGTPSGCAIRNSAVVIGREGSGLSPEVRDAVLRGCIGSVHVAMEGELESLNAAVCGSVILFEYARQKREHARRSAVKT